MIDPKTLAAQRAYYGMKEVYKRMNAAKKEKARTEEKTATKPSPPRPPKPKPHSPQAELLATYVHVQSVTVACVECGRHPRRVSVPGTDTPRYIGRIDFIPADGTRSILHLLIRKGVALNVLQDYLAQCAHVCAPCVTKRRHIKPTVTPTP